MTADDWQPMSTAPRPFDWNVIVGRMPNERMAELVREAVRKAFIGQTIAAKKLGGPVVLDSSRIIPPYTKDWPYEVVFRWVRAPEPQPLPAPPEPGG